MEEISVIVPGMLFALWFFTAQGDGDKIGPFSTRANCERMRTSYASLTKCWERNAAVCGNGIVELPEFCDPPGGPYGKGSVCENYYCSEDCTTCSSDPDSRRRRRP